MARYFQKTLIPFGGEIPTLSAFQHAVCCGSMMYNNAIPTLKGKHPSCPQRPKAFNAFSVDAWYKSRSFSHIAPISFLMTRKN